jgi:hypothetical protein
LEIGSGREIIYHYIRPPLKWKKIRTITELRYKHNDVTRCYAGPPVGCCEHGNEPSDFIKGEEFLDYLIDYWLLKDSAPWSCLVS